MFLFKMFCTVFTAFYFTYWITFLSTCSCVKMMSWERAIYVYLYLNCRSQGSYFPVSVAWGYHHQQLLPTTLLDQGLRPKEPPAKWSIWDLIYFIPGSPFTRPLGPTCDVLVSLPGGAGPPRFLPITLDSVTEYASAHRDLHVTYVRLCSGGVREVAVLPSESAPPRHQPDHLHFAAHSRYCWHTRRRIRLHRAFLHQLHTGGLQRAVCW